MWLVPITPNPLSSRSVLACAAAALAVTALSGCDAAPAADTGTRQVTVVGSGEVQGTPDTLTADIGVEVVAPDVNAAMNQAGERQTAVIDALSARGIDAEDISTAAVSVQPQYGENSLIAGYRAGNSIKVVLRELDAAATTLATAVAAGGNAARINSVSFSIQDDSALLTDARARAFDDARNRAEQYAELSGLPLGKVVSISEAPAGSQTPAPAPMPAPTGAMAKAVPLQPGKQTVGFAVTVVWELG